MKKYITILVGIIALSAFLFGGYTFLKRHSVKPVAQIQSETPMRSFSSDVVRVFEGENKLAYSFDIPETATTSLGMDNALVRITDATSSYATMYMSYEGARGFTPLEYVSEIIAPHVSVINPTGTSTIGVYEWQAAESDGSEWHVASVNNGAWLIIVENKKAVHDLVEKTLESVKTN